MSGCRWRRECRSQRAAFSNIIPDTRAHSILLARRLSSEACLLLPRRRRGSGAPTGARVQRHPFRGPVTQARRRLRGALHLMREMLASRRSVAGFMASGPAQHSKTTRLRTHASSSRPLVVAEGGFPAPPGCCLQGSARDTASRPAYAMPRESTLGGRDVRTICLSKQRSNEIVADAVQRCWRMLMGAARGERKARRHRHNSRPQKNASSPRERSDMREVCYGPSPHFASLIARRRQARLRKNDQARACAV
jgi:hypothetical protein